MDPPQDLNDAAYMAMLTRNIPGVGTAPVASTSVSNPPASDAGHITSNNHSVASTTLTDKQRRAIQALDAARHGAFFVSEGDEPFETAHIVPSSLVAATTTTEASTTDQRPAPTAAELLAILRDAQLINDEDAMDADCEKDPHLRDILEVPYPGAKELARTVCDLFNYDATSASKETSTVALYRVSLPSSPARIHIWILGWIDQHLIGLHTISIET
ncbi:hypothetical protein BGZ99_008693 [Dissophora globulifera]|uniref:Uncharacterized protein n=1 Tax=Dissophora globulifera TaxID=979702 RepID=A0A9P6RV42_9FUNG|nr:hypothetical protein BGZ99_008693 [Dissophora globulifera]